MSRTVLVLTNPHRPATHEAGEVAIAALKEASVHVVTEFDRAQFEATGSTDIDAAMILGGDGTMLHAVDLTYGTGIPLLGVNLGRVGFLAELERDDVAHAAQLLGAGEFFVEPRGTLDVTVTRLDGTQVHGWALNEVTVERVNSRRILDVLIDVDGVPLSSFGCDGAIIATPTGSTAHAFSAGGPVIWPSVNAMLFVPLAAHALFARPLVLGPASVLGLELRDNSESPANAVCDGSRVIDVDPGCRVEVRTSDTVVPLARLSDAPFTERLVRKFSLPTQGWRGEPDEPVVRLDQPDEDG